MTNNDAGTILGVNTTGEAQADQVANQGTTVTVEPGATAPQSVENGKAARLEQELSKMNRALKSLGVDPDSDVVDKINRGIMTWDDVLNRQQPTQQVQPQPRRASDKLAQVYQKVHAAEPTADDFKEALAAMVDAVKDQEARESAQTTQQIVSAVKGSVYNVIDNDDLHKQLPPDLAALERDVFYSSTDHFVSDEAFKSPNPNRFFTPETYKYYAEMNANRYNKLREHYINLGRQQERQALQQPKTNQTNVVPISAGAGISPATPPVPQVTKANMKQAAEAYLRQMRQI
jgi:hypothetical protein